MAADAMAATVADASVATVASVADASIDYGCERRLSNWEGSLIYSNIGIYTLKFKLI